METLANGLSPAVYEVEAKFFLTDAEAFREALAREGFAATRTEEHIDRYFRHPARDFAATDEALRLRAVTVDGVTDAVLTYKGPRDDGPVKAREEIETPVPQPSEVASVLAALGFSPVAVVENRRDVFTRESTAATVTIDTVLDVGTYAEVEQVVANENRDAASELVLRTAAALGLPASAREPRSYLEMLLAGSDARPANSHHP